MRKKNVLILFGASILLSIISICISLIRSEPLTWDGMSVLVGILSLLVTILLGWQIYTFIDIENKIKRIIKEEFDKKTKDVYTAIIGNTLTYQVEDAKFYIENREWNRALSLQTHILQGYINLNQKEKVEETVDLLTTFFHLHIKDVSPENITRTIKELKKAIPHSDKAYELLLFIGSFFKK